MSSSSSTLSDGRIRVKSDNSNFYNRDYNCTSQNFYRGGRLGCLNSGYGAVSTGKCMILHSIISPTLLKPDVWHELIRIVKIKWFKRLNFFSEKCGHRGVHNLQYRFSTGSSFRMRGPQVESLVSLGWCIRRGTWEEGDGDADYLPVISFCAETTAES